MATGKRKNGEGSWGEKIIHGDKYQYYRDENRKYTYGKTVAEVKAKLKEKEKLAKENAPLTKKEIERLDFGTYLSDYLKTKIKTIEPKTYDRYEDSIQNMINKYSRYDIGGKQVGVLNSDMFVSYINALTNDYSRSSISRILSLMRQCLTARLNLDIPSEEKNRIRNILSVLNVPKETHVKVKKKKVKYTSQEDMDLLYEESKRVNAPGYQFGGKIGEKTYGNSALAIVFIMYTGLRISELCGLRWKNYNPTKKTILIEEASVLVKERDEDGNVIKHEDERHKFEAVLKEPKSDEGIRSINLPDIALEVLDEFDKMFPKHKGDDFIFLSSTGNPINRFNISRTLTSMCKRAQCEYVYTPHELRHGYGSILISNGVDIKTVSKLLGHESIEFTLKIYIGVYEKNKIAAAEVFNKLAKESKAKPTNKN